MITRIDIAEIWEGLGGPEQAAVYRYLDEPDHDALTAEELADEIDALLSKLPAGSKKHVETHNGDDWTKCVQCLADRIEELLPA